MVLSLPYGSALTFYVTTGKTIALTIQTFVGKVMPLLFNTLSRFVIAFLPRSKHLLISWLKSPSVVILDPQKVNSVTVSIASPSIFHEEMGPEAMIYLDFFNVEFKVSFFILLFHLHQEILWFLFAFCHNGDVICISEIIDISPSNLNSSLCFIQPSVSHGVLCIEVQGDSIQPRHTPFPICKLSVVPRPVLTVAS